VTDQPLLRIVSGEPTAEELAALVVVIARLGAESAPPPPPARLGWASHQHQLRRPLVVGPGGWSASGRVPGTRTKAGW
jgi:hypothetical protein